MLVKHINDTTAKTSSSLICATSANAVTFVVNKTDITSSGVKIVLAKTAEGELISSNTANSILVAGNTNPSLSFQPKYQPYLKRGDLVCVSLDSSVGLTPANECLASYSYLKDKAGNHIVWGISSVTAKDGILNDPSIVDSKNLTTGTVATIFQK